MGYSLRRICMIVAWILYLKPDTVALVEVNFTGFLSNKGSSFQCTASREPIHCSVEMLIDNSSRTVIRHSNATCVHSYGNCYVDNTCSCSTTCLTFTWSTNLVILQNQTVSCQARFTDKTTNGYKVIKASAVYNGKEYIQLNKGIHIKKDVEKIKTETETFSDETPDAYIIAFGIMITISLTVFSILMITAAHRIRRCCNKHKTDQDQKLISLRKKDLNIVDYHDNEKEGSAFSLGCDNCFKDKVSFCRECKHFYCALCTVKHITGQYHEVFLIEPLVFTTILCHFCHKNNVLKICMNCKKILCKDCQCNCRSQNIRGIVRCNGDVEKYLHTI